jgi:hypothetical protein
MVSGVTEREGSVGSQYTIQGYSANDLTSFNLSLFLKDWSSFQEDHKLGSKNFHQWEIFMSRDTTQAGTFLFKMNDILHWNTKKQT